MVRKRATAEVLPGESCLKIFLRSVLNVPVRFGFMAVVSRDPSQEEAPFSFFPPPPPATPAQPGQDAPRGRLPRRRRSHRRSPRVPSPLGGAFTVQTRLRQQSMEQFGEKKKRKRKRK